jgi:hypothetical protein
MPTKANITLYGGVENPETDLARILLCASAVNFIRVMDEMKDDTTVQAALIDLDQQCRVYLSSLCDRALGDTESIEAERRIRPMRRRRIR